MSPINIHNHGNEVLKKFLKLLLKIRPTEIPSCIKKVCVRTKENINIIPPSQLPVPTAIAKAAYNIPHGINVVHAPPVTILVFPPVNILDSHLKLGNFNFFSFKRHIPTKIMVIPGNKSDKRAPRIG